MLQHHSRHSWKDNNKNDTEEAHVSGFENSFTIDIKEKQLQGNQHDLTEGWSLSLENDGDRLSGVLEVGATVLYLNLAAQVEGTIWHQF